MTLTEALTVAYLAVQSVALGLTVVGCLTRRDARRKSKARDLVGGMDLYRLASRRFRQAAIVYSIAAVVVLGSVALYTH